MKPYFSSLKKISLGTELQFIEDTLISDVFIDSRNALLHKSSIFFAIKGARNNGHQFIASLYHDGVRNFVVEEEIEEVSEILGKQAAIAGFYSYGEIAPFFTSNECNLHNQTMTLTLISE